MAAENKSQKIRFKANPDKIKAAVLFCIEQNGGSINVYNMMKILFEADKYHLNKHGRPVTGDAYKAMEKGTVPSRAYNMAKEMNPTKHVIFSDEKPNLRKLSKSDIEALLKGFEKYAGKTFGQVHDLNHEERAWKETERNAWIDFEKMIENPEILEYLKERDFNVSV